MCVKNDSFLYLIQDSLPSLRSPRMTRNFFINANYTTVILGRDSGILHFQIYAICLFFTEVIDVTQKSKVMCITFDFVVFLGECSS